MLQYTMKHFNHVEQKHIDRFHTKYEKKDSGCWEWTGAKDQWGYGYLNVNKRAEKVHRFSWLIVHRQEWPTDKPVARHLCNNPSCVNPEHIVPGTHKENTADMINFKRDKGTFNVTKPTTCPHCNFTTTLGNAKRWHFDNCKVKI
jgi:hypothetical protein